jgi:alkyl sulfatase BDS1-like metallo-beta-lactamase superfamily hydrolase
MIEEMETFISKFNSDEKMKEKTKGKIECISIEITDIEKTYYLVLKDGQLTPIESEKIDIKISMDRKTLAGLVNETINARDVYNKSLKVDASWGDMLLLMKVLS